MTSTGYKVAFFVVGVVFATQALAADHATQAKPAKQSRAKPAPQAKHYAVFNDGAVGIEERTLVRINDLPCGRNGKDRFLFCLPKVTIAEGGGVFQDTQYLIQNFSKELKRWNSNAKDKDSQWSALLYSNLSAVVFDPNIKSPELRIQRGTGNPLPESEMSFYLKLPQNFSLEALRKWIKKLGEDSREDPIVAKFQELPTREFMSMVFRCPKDIQIGGIQTYQPGSIVIDKIKPTDSRYADTKAEQDAVELAIDLGKQERMKATHEECGKERTQGLFNHCLMTRHYSGPVDHKPDEFRKVGYMLDGKWEGLLQNCSDYFCIERDYVHGQMQASRVHTRGKDGRFYLNEESKYQNEHYVGPTRKYRPNGGLRQETFYNEKDQPETIYSYCPDGKTVSRMETSYDGERIEVKSYPCPGAVNYYCGDGKTIMKIETPGYEVETYPCP